MNNSISPLLPSVSQIQPEQNISLPLSKFPPHILEAIKRGISGRLEILPHQNQLTQAILYINGETFDFTLPGNIFSVNQTESKFFDVKVGNNGQLFILKDTEKFPQIPLNSQPEDKFPQIEIYPIKLSAMITESLTALKVPEIVIKHISQDIMPLEVSLSAIGKTVDTTEILQPLQKIISDFGACPDIQLASQLKERLQSAISSLIGKQIGGEILNRTNDMTFIKTPLGTTFFSAKIKLPQAEKIILTINSQVSGLKQELNFLDNLLSILRPHSNIDIKPEFISSYPQLKNLARLSELDPQIFSSIIKNLPFSNTRLLENIYDFYQASVHKNLSKWIKPDTLQLSSLKAENKNMIIDELNSFLFSSLKETPSWRIVEMPLFDATTFKPLKIAVKKDQDQQQGKDHRKDEITRFIVETGFSKLGNFQFDGLSDKSKRHFDLIIRTSQNLDKDFCSNIINLFKKSLYDLNYSGTIKINLKEDFINFQNETNTTRGIYI